MYYGYKARGSKRLSGDRHIETGKKRKMFRLYLFLYGRILSCPGLGTAQ
jgi:hypothetical protein